MADPYRAGFNAHQSDEPMEANPYPKLTEDWERWADGWLEAELHESDKGEALDSIGWSG